MKYLIFLLSIVCCLGCQTAAKPLPSNFTQEDLKHAASAFSIQGSDVKYCPVDGKHFSGRLEMCPEHKVKLIPVSSTP